MPERLYSEYPALYDAIQSSWDYDRDVAFVEAARERHDVAGDRLLEIGCGTGEHTKRFADAGDDVTAIDPFEGMLSLAREKCD
ncbi:MAG TPA: class I SAM-dependent methyltransferase, partial [Natrialbaceae archaeon]|nr:class I SAM-dependent methyltransferase [Natrialbaceae archaeon]